MDSVTSVHQVLTALYCNCCDGRVVGESSQGERGAAESSVVEGGDVARRDAASSAAEGQRAAACQVDRASQRTRRREDGTRTARTTVGRRHQTARQAPHAARREKPSSRGTAHLLTYLADTFGAWFVKNGDLYVASLSSHLLHRHATQVGVYRIMK